MEWLPTKSADVEKGAVPEPSKKPVPRVANPSMNVTDPVGMPKPGKFAVTLAMNVMNWPKTDGLGEDVTIEVEASPLTICVNEDEVPGVKSLSPL